MYLMQYVSDQIRALRTGYGREGLSQEALAKAVNTTANTISRWETGTYKPSLEDLDRLAQFFGVSILEFFPKTTNADVNSEVSALLRAAEKLPAEDIKELRSYAEFRRARSLYENGSRSRPGRKRHEA